MSGFQAESAVRGGGRVVVTRRAPWPLCRERGQQERRPWLAEVGQRIGRHKHGKLDSGDRAEDPESEIEELGPHSLDQLLAGPQRTGRSACGGWAPEGHARGKRGR